YSLSTSLPLNFLLLLFYSYGAPRDLHSFPTRRSSDLGRSAPVLLEQQQPAREVAHRTRAEEHERVRGALHRAPRAVVVDRVRGADRKSTRLNSSHVKISYAVFCLKKKKKATKQRSPRY